jgi:membrane-bound lytic murein transglycosylase D
VRGAFEKLNRINTLRVAAFANFLIFSAAFASPPNFDLRAPVTSTAIGSIGNDEIPWVAPNFLNQESALGYVSKDFIPTPELHDRVMFWTQIYGKYSASQGIMHDRYDLRLVYSVVDFAELEDNIALSRTELEKLKEKRVQKQRDVIFAVLTKLTSVTDPKNLTPEERKIWNLFPEKDRAEKIKKAANKDFIRFQLGQSNYFKKGIYYSGRYIRQMERIFREEGLPVELTRLPFVESSFNIFARSKVGASGIWQFMRGTGRDYLKINKWVDERNDPLASSRAAARLLRSNYRELNSWPIAITAYNHGPSGMKRLMKDYETTSIVDLIEKAETPSFQFASRNFYACLLAAIEVEAHADKYFTKPVIAPEVPFETYVLPKAVSYKSLLKIWEGDTMKSELLNPQFTSLVKRGALLMPAGTKLRIPIQKTAEYTAMVQGPLAKEMMKTSTAAGNPYRVASGDSISSIAQTFGISMKSLMELNAISNPRSLKPGQTLYIPTDD